MFTSFPDFLWSVNDAYFKTVVPPFPAVSPFHPFFIEGMEFQGECSLIFNEMFGAKPFVSEFGSEKGNLLVFLHGNI